MLSLLEGESWVLLSDLEHACARVHFYNSSTRGSSASVCVKGAAIVLKGGHTTGQRRTAGGSRRAIPDAPREDVRAKKTLLHDINASSTGSTSASFG